MIPTRVEDLLDLAAEVYKASAKLAGRVHPITARKLTWLLRNVNSYYSNLIEGIRTYLLDIEAGLKELSEDDRTRKLQILHRQNILAQEELSGHCSVDGEEVVSRDFLCRLHGLLFQGLPREFLVQRDPGGQREVVMEPGKLRHLDVKVQQHVPPPAGELEMLLGRFARAYGPGAARGCMRLVAAAASHHRLLWIHPFLEGNGRVARLFTDSYLVCCGLDGYGLWAMSRGLARNEPEYKSLLAVADAPRRGDYDGRGNLSEQGLRKFCTFFLEIALDQARFMDELLCLDVVVKNIDLYCTLRAKGHLVGKAQLPKESARILSHVFIHGSLGKGEVHTLLGVSDRKARDVVKSLVNEGLLETGNQKAPLTIGLPAQAVQFLFPELCDAGAFSPAT